MSDQGGPPLPRGPGGGPPGQPTLLLLHHLEPPLEWERALAVLKSAVGAPGYSGGPPSNSQGGPLDPQKLQQLLVDLEAAVEEGYRARVALLQQGTHGRPPPGGGHCPGGPPANRGYQLQLPLGPPWKQSSRARRNFTRLFAAVSPRARGPFFAKALPLLLEACAAAETIFPRCTRTSPSAAAARPSAAPADSDAEAATSAAAAKAIKEEEETAEQHAACSCPSCRLRLQLSSRCSSGACSSSSSSIRSRKEWGSPHVRGCAAELSAAEGWVLFGLGFLGLLPPPHWQETISGFPRLGDLSFAEFFTITSLLLLLLLLSLLFVVLHLKLLILLRRLLLLLLLFSLHESLTVQLLLLFLLLLRAELFAARPAVSRGPRCSESLRLCVSLGAVSPAGPDQAGKLHCFLRYCCCMAAAVEAFHAKCLLRGVRPFAFSPPHLAARCCKNTAEEETVQALHSMLEEEVHCLLHTEPAPAAAAEAALAGAAGAAAAGAATVCSEPGKSPLEGRGSGSSPGLCCACKCAACSSSSSSSSSKDFSCLVKVAGGGPLGKGPCGAGPSGPWPLTFPCCFVLRCLRISRGQADAACCSLEQVTLQQRPLLSPQVVEAEIEGGGVPCSEALDVRADFANAVIGGGVLYHGSLQEEVFFSVSPELLLLRPLSQHLGVGEAAHCLGALRFSRFRGYARSFCCRLNGEEETPRAAASVSQPQQRAQGPRVNKQQQNPSNAAHAARPLLLSAADSEDEEPAAAAAAATAATTAAAAATRDAEEGEEGWVGLEGVEAVDSTPLRVQWLSPQEPAHPSRGAPPSKAPERLLRVETASVVAALDARQFAAAAAAAGGAAAAAAAKRGGPGGLSSEAAGGRELLHPLLQFRADLMMREIQKVSAALHLPPLDDEEAAAAAEEIAAAADIQADRETDSRLRPFTTGNWGCGFFGGDPQLKFVLQWLGSSLCGRRMRYFAWGLPALLEGGLLSRVVGALLGGPFPWTCGGLWGALLEGSLGSPPPLRQMGVFPYLLQRAAAAAAVPSPLETPGTGRPFTSSSSSSSSGGGLSSSSSKREREDEQGAGGPLVKRACRDGLTLRWQPAAVSPEADGDRRRRQTETAHSLRAAGARLLVGYAQQVSAQPATLRRRQEGDTPCCPHACPPPACFRSR
ncbi:hypothetical protein Efla_004814 [Eimeria flavescens]